MALKYQNTYRVPSARALWHDYNGGLYFITICTSQKVSYFGRISEEVMQLNQLGEHLRQIIEEVPLHHPYAQVPLYVIMPNHLHLIICIRSRDEVEGVDDIPTGHARDVACVCGDVACHVSTDMENITSRRMRYMAQNRGLLSVTVGNIKSALKHYATEHNIGFAWQTRFHDRIIRDQNECNRIADYIENNPATWMTDQFYGESV